MEKRKVFYETRFTSSVIAAARSILDDVLADMAPGIIHEMRSIWTSSEDQMSYDSDAEFFAALDTDYSTARYQIAFTMAGVLLYVDIAPNASIVTVGAPDRTAIDTIFGLFDEANAACKMDVVARVFIGHGQSPQWRKLRDHLVDKHSYEVVAYEIGTRTGYPVQGILESMMRGSNFAIILLTAEDETADGDFQPRLNVVHELGLFQGKLGFPRVVPLVEEGTSLFSNLEGTQQIRFEKHSIEAAFGDIVATIRREFVA